MNPAPTERFTTRVESYRHYRPTYPPAVADLLRRACGLTSESTLADVAAGTGILTETLLAAGFAVTAVEPNDAMRAACTALESQYPRLRCIAGTAEATGLQAHSIDLITAAQAMHWFDLPKTRTEFVRILKPGAWCAVLYNHRRMGGDAFHDGYEQLLRDYGSDYLAVQGKHMTEGRLREFFAPSAMQCASFPNAQKLSLEGLEGRILSSSYMPQPGHLRFEELQAAMERLFEENQSGEEVTLEYDCVACYGQLR